MVCERIIQYLPVGLVDYEDGTPATASQMAKDVTHFLNWTASPEHVQLQFEFADMCAG
jgi:cytochrome c1